ncbi:MAG: class I SAM-dependent methyltransferase [Bdellovibrionota bacterium]|nr:MAG: class I SAM-dependent methyltransferase [Bdellovibrionota bacterium]
MVDQPPQTRYQHKPFYGSSHTWAIDILDPRPLGSESAILDIGTGAGYFGHYFEQRGVPLRVGVEIDEQARAHCAPCYSRMVASLDALLSEPEGSYDGVFDVVLLLDVLEHIANPFEFLTRVTPLLKPKGIVLISVPNIAHWSIRLSLLAGYFEYTERGILDRTHLHFFSRRHFRQLCNANPELRLLSSSASIVPLELLLPESLRHAAPFRWFAFIRKAAAVTLPNLFGYQHLAVLERKQPHASPDRTNAR